MRGGVGLEWTEGGWGAARTDLRKPDGACHDGVEATDSGGGQGGVI